ncbi:MAG: energy transducer TonB [Acidobacteriota bacterium]
MRTLLALTVAFLPLLQAQDSRMLKSVEPRYDTYSEDLATDFDVASASVTLTIGSDGKPFALDNSSLPLPMAVVMALKDYEFRPQGVVPHGRPINEGDTYQVTLTVPIRQRKELRTPQNPAPATATSVSDTQPAIRLPLGVVQGLRVKSVAPTYPEAAKHARLQGRITFEAVLTKQGDVGRLTASNGPFLLIEAAYDAVKQWQYKPYILKHEPVEVLTDIAINFNLN